MKTMKNKTYCNGKFLLKETKDSEDIKFDNEIERGIENNRKKEFNKLSPSEKALSRKCEKLNVEIREAVFDYIRHIGYDVYDVEVGNGYFIFEMGKGSVVHFKIKGPFLKKYQFGMWIDARNYFHKYHTEMTNAERKKFSALDDDVQKRYYDVIQIFQQHEDYINKFKPSNSSPVITVHTADAKILLEKCKNVKKGKEKEDTDEFNDGYSYDIMGLKDLLLFMSKYPFRHYAGLLNHGSYLLSYVDELSFSHPFLYFIKDRFEFYRDKTVKGVKRWFGFHKAVRICKAMAKESCVKSVTMTNFSNVIMDGCSTNYEYKIEIVFTKESSVEECSDAFDRHITERKIGEYDNYDCVAEVMVDRNLKKEADYTDESGNHHDFFRLLGWDTREEEKRMYDIITNNYSNFKKQKNKKDRAAFIKKYPTIEEYARKSFYYDYGNKCLIRAVCYNNGTDYTVVTEEVPVSKWERM